MLPFNGHYQYSKPSASWTQWLLKYLQPDHTGSSGAFGKGNRNFYTTFQFTFPGQATPYGPCWLFHSNTLRWCQDQDATIILGHCSYLGDLRSFDLEYRAKSIQPYQVFIFPSRAVTSDLILRYQDGLKNAVDMHFVPLSSLQPAIFHRGEETALFQYLEGKPAFGSTPAARKGIAFESQLREELKNSLGQDVISISDRSKEEYGRGNIELGNHIRNLRSGDLYLPEWDLSIEIKDKSVLAPESHLSKWSTCSPNFRPPLPPEPEWILMGKSDLAELHRESKAKLWIWNITAPHQPPYLLITLLSTIRTGLPLWNTLPNIPTKVPFSFWVYDLKQLALTPPIIPFSDPPIPAITRLPFILKDLRDLKTI